MDKNIQLEGDGISVKLVAMDDKEVTLEVCATKGKQSLCFWTVEHLKEGDTWYLSGCDKRHIIPRWSNSGLLS